MPQNQDPNAMLTSVIRFKRASFKLIKGSPGVVPTTRVELGLGVWVRGLEFWVLVFKVPQKTLFCKWFLGFYKGFSRCLVRALHEFSVF